ncbi:MAG: phage minor capsid protein [Vicinamibacteria bacterium]
MSVSRELQSLLASAENVAALEEQYARSIDRILQELAQGITRPGAARARETLLRIRELAQRLDPRRQNAVRRWLEDEFPKFYYLGDDAAARGIDQARGAAAPERRGLVGEPSTGFTALNQLQLRAQVAALTDRLSDVHRQILIKSGLVVRRTQLVFSQDAEIREHVIGGIIRGETHREVANDIARTILTGKVSPAAAERMRQAGFAGDVALFEQLGRRELVTVGKKTMDVRVYANLVARTMGAETHRVGMITRLQQNEINHVRISRHQQTEEDECTLYAGRVFYVGPGEDPLGFPSMNTIPSGGPPWHPNCAHVVTPFVVAAKPPAAVEAALEDINRLPGGAFAVSAKEARELVEVLREAGKLEEIAPKGAADVKPPPKKGAA